MGNSTARCSARASAANQGVGPETRANRQDLEGTLTLVRGVTADRRSIRALLGSGAAQDRLKLTDAAGGDVLRAAADQLVLVAHPPGEADVELARRLDVSTAVVIMAARRTWGRTLTEERDRRVAALGDMDMGGTSGTSRPSHPRARP